MFKKILIGVGVAVVALMALGASDCEVETDTPTSEAPPAAEAPAATESPAAVDECYLTASCQLTNGWTLDVWSAVVDGVVYGYGEGSTPETEALAGCVADVVMLRMTVPELLELSDDEAYSQGFDIAGKECFPLIVATLE